MENKITSIKKIARIGGVLYLIIIIAGIFGEMFVRDKLIVSGDATTTANNIMASQLLWRIGIVGDILMHVCDVGLMVVFYILLKPVNKNLVLIAVLFALIQTAVLVAYKIKLFEALFLLGSADYLKAFEPQQLHVLMYIAIKTDGYGFGIGLIFFGFACLVLGYLIFRSGYIPKIFGVMMQIAGLCYLTNSFTLLLAPKFADIIFPAILVPCFIAELSFCIWLLVKGVNLPKWEKQVSAM
jgi:hypothetical protein